ncbi:MAG: hypothetical protein STHCBS139747_008048 [Sporothrix thermara]
MSPRIAIVGAGPAGLTLGVLLHKQRIPFTIFELRNEPTAAAIARPSGMLDLHSGSGLEAIAACGLTDEFMPLTGECSQQFLVANRAGELVYTAAADRDGPKRPEISRNNLTALLRRHVSEDSIRWGHRVRSVTSSPEGTVLEFGDPAAQPSAGPFDLVVGADGAWSKVRALLTPAVRPQFSGMHCITLTVTHLTTRFPQLAALVGSGSFCALGRRHAIVSQRGPLDSARLYLWLTVADDEHFAATAGLADKPAAAAKPVLLEDEALLGTFGPVLKELVATACDEDAATDRDDGLLDTRAFYALPPDGYTWASQPGVTLLGDAAHLMLPNGEGVNMAMLDALHLSRAVAKAYNQESKAQFLKALDLPTFEKDMAARAAKELKETDEHIERMFGNDDAAFGFVAWMKAMFEQATAQGKEGSEEAK